MAVIKETLTLADKFSGTLNRFANKMSSTSKMVQAAASVVEGQNNRMASTAQSATDRMVDSAEKASVGVSDATQELVDRLGIVEESMRSAFTDKQADAALSALEQQMRRVGLVWTTSAAEMEGADLLMRVGLQELANQGQIAANVIAQAAHTTQLEKEAAQQAAQAEKERATAISKVRSAIGGAIGTVASHTASLFRNITATQSAGRAHGLLARQLRRMAFTFFSVRRIFRFLSETIERAPKGLQKSWNGAVTGVRDTFARTFASMLQSMQPAIDRFNAFLNSPAGKRFAHGLETAMSLAGQAVGWLLDKVTALGTWVGDNFATAAAIGGTMLALFAGKMFLVALATMAANWPLLLLSGTISAFVIGMQAAGFSAQEVSGMIAGVFAAAGALIANTFFGLVELTFGIIEFWYNGFASVANFIGNIFRDPIGSAIRLFGDLADIALGVLEKIASAMDFVFGSNFARSVSGWRSGLSSMVKDAANKHGNGSYERLVERLDVSSALANLGLSMERFNYKDAYSAGYDWGSNLSDKFSSKSLDAKLSPKLTNIEKNTAKTAQNTNSWDEDLAMLEDVTIRRYSTKVNTTSLVPNITVNLRGDRDKDMAVDIGNTLKVMLAEQMASHTAVNYSGV